MTTTVIMEENIMSNQIVDANGHAIDDTTSADQDVNQSEGQSATTLDTEDVSEADTTEPVLDQDTVDRKSNADKVVAQAEYGYVVAVLPDGSLAFQEIGSKLGYIQLLGLHQFADYRINVISDSSQKYGAALIAHQQQQIAQMLQVALNMLTNQSKQQIMTAAR